MLEGLSALGGFLLMCGIVIRYYFYFKYKKEKGHDHSS